jgi:hypothetical protein
MNRQKFINIPGRDGRVRLDAIDACAVEYSEDAEYHENAQITYYFHNGTKMILKQSEITISRGYTELTSLIYRSKPLFYEIRGSNWAVKPSAVDAYLLDYFRDDAQTLIDARLTVWLASGDKLSYRADSVTVCKEYSKLEDMLALG